MSDDQAPLVIDARGLTKRYGKRTVVDHFDLKVPRGYIYGFLGPNGSGKTTTIRMLCGLLTPDDGEGTCLGYDIRRESALIKPQVGYMPQKFGLYDDLSIEENLDFIGRLYAVPQRAAKVDQALDELGLASRRKQLAGALSGGWKQRLALAACLLHEPQLLLLDEPTAGVDPKARRDFWDRLHALAAGGLTVLVSTHYMDEAERCHALAYISYGRLLAHGSAASLIQQAALTTYSLHGPSSALAQLALRLEHDERIATVASFGAELHASAQSEAALQAALQQAQAAMPGVEIKARRTDTSLEDVFIALMKQAKDNYG